jgi:hypothetical protein
MSKSKKLQQWIKSLPREKLDEIAFQCIDRLIDSEELNYNPERTGDAPYWDSCGIRLGEDE